MSHLQSAIPRNLRNIDYAIKIIFDDGHNTGIYSWTYLYELGSKIQNS